MRFNRRPLRVTYVGANSPVFLLRRGSPWVALDRRGSLWRVTAFWVRAFFIGTRAFVLVPEKYVTIKTRPRRLFGVRNCSRWLGREEVFNYGAGKDLQVRLIRLEIQSANGRGERRSGEWGLGGSGGETKIRLEVGRKAAFSSPLVSLSSTKPGAPGTRQRAPGIQVHTHIPTCRHCVVGPKTNGRIFRFRRLGRRTSVPMARLNRPLLLPPLD